MSTSTIAAISTGLTNSGVSIIRISGPESINIINKIFDNCKKIGPNKIVYGNIIKDGSVLDNVLVSYFKSPKSYTGEDVIEINCHGGIIITRELLQYVLDSGATLATPGEFSKRAFLNGKMDLTKAEATIDLINAHTLLETKIFASQINGNLMQKIRTLKEDLIELLAHISVSIDYPEYDYEEVSYEKISSLINIKINEIKKLVDTYEQGKYLKNGINLAILGKPNVGKSSLLNRLANSNKAIVTDIPGTTRDIVEERINVGEFILNIYDTAGIRNTDDIVEKIGVEKSIEILDKVDIVVYMLNLQNQFDEEDFVILKKIKEKNINYIVLVNKIDLEEDNKVKLYLESLKEKEISNIMLVSIKNNDGIDKVIEKIKNIFNNNNIDFNTELIITNQRHKELLNNSLKSLESAIKEVKSNVPVDIVSIYLKEATSYLEEIIGENVNEDVTKKIFEKFCLGK